MVLSENWKSLRQRRLGLLSWSAWIQQSIVLVEQGDRLHSAEELLEQVAFVRGVDGVSFQSEAHKQRVCAKDLLHICQNGDNETSRGRGLWTDASGLRTEATKPLSSAKTAIKRTPFFIESVFLLHFLCKQFLAGKVSDEQADSYSH